MRRAACARAAKAIALTVVVGSFGACGGGGASSAADPFIAQAENGEERDGLVAARDDVDAEMSAVAAEKDRELAKLKAENEALKSRLASRKKR